DQALLNSANENLMKVIVDNTGQGTTWFICDASTDEDLKIIADTFAKVNKKTVWAGSAGLIEYLPNALQLIKAEKNQQEELAITKTLTVSASLSMVTKQQLEMVKTMADTHFVEIDPVDLIKKTYSVPTIIEEFTKQSSKKHFVLFVDSSVENRQATKQLGTELSIGNTQISEAISMELGVIAKAIVNSMPNINGLILTGGDTAKAVCNQLNMNQMQLYTEIEAGLPLGKLGNATSSRRYWTVTKAGGFGNEHSLLNALKYMTREDV
ncbi:MAG: nucleotide-binding domain containing protein, partial [Bacillus sp. (in: firmicutes)]